jgi:hypothetical protein
MEEVAASRQLPESVAVKEIFHADGAVNTVVFVHVLVALLVGDRWYDSVVLLDQFFLSPESLGLLSCESVVSRAKSRVIVVVVEDADLDLVRVSCDASLSVTPPAPATATADEEQDT